jgi:hypothetical protein
MKNPHAVALGRKGGKVTSKAKAQAARENGKKGGAPKKVAAAVAILFALVTAACSGSNPSAPTPPPSQPQPITLTVHVTGTGSGQPLAGVAGELGGLTAVTNGDGGLQLQTAPSAAQRLSLTGSGIVPRSVMLAVNGTREVSVDAIPSAGFDLNFYRQLVRNGFEQPAALQPLRRWTEAPRIYLKTVDEAGAAVDARTLDATTRAIVETAAIFTGGRFGVAELERGTETRAGVPGWVTVRWTAGKRADNLCGQSDVGVSGGAIDLFYKQGAFCECPGVSDIRPRLVRHELGHAFGFWHTDNQNDVMFKTALGCDLLPSARERAAAAIAYARPVGNQDPDSDPSSVVTLSPLRVP